MGRKKHEHITFDQTRKQKKNIPFTKVNKASINPLASTIHNKKTKIPN